MYKALPHMKSVANGYEQPNLSSYLVKDSDRNQQVSCRHLSMPAVSCDPKKHAAPRAVVLPSANQEISSGSS